MKISVSATNPCHLFHLARELHQIGTLGTYYSGYPKWKLAAPDGMPVKAFPLRTMVTYGLLRSPRRIRPKDRSLFRWQDGNFDRRVAGALSEVDSIHGMPGQCLHTFRRARELGITTVLNHATGPSDQLADAVRPEFDRVGLRFETETAYDSSYFEREAEEYQLADFHCVASSTVREQLIARRGIPAHRIWTIPYGADSKVFFPPENRQRPAHFRIVFAGQLSLRKGVRFLLDALAEAGDASWQVDFFGARSPETGLDIDTYEGAPALKFHGPVSQSALADAFRAADVLVLPSLEEGFGLVVVQALSCGLPCVVSDAVGAKDLITHRTNGSVFPASNSAALATELRYWYGSRDKRVNERHPWSAAARALVAASAELATLEA